MLGSTISELIRKVNNHAFKDRNTRSPTYTMRNSLLIIGDDLGLAPAVDRGLLGCLARGEISAPALMATCDNAGELLAQIRKLGGSMVGLHITLSEVTQRPRSAAFSAAFGKCDRFPGREAAIAQLLQPNAELRRALRAELAAQIDAVQAAGLRINHISSHHHVHALPSVAEALLDVLGDSAIGSPWVRGYGEYLGPPTSKAYALLAAHAQTATRMYRKHQLNVTHTLGFRTLAQPDVCTLEAELQAVAHVEHPLEWMVHIADYAAGELDIGLARQTEFALLQSALAQGGALARTGFRVHQFNPR